MALQLQPAPYAGSRVALATMHGKENAVAQPFRTHLQMQVVVPEFLDTDCFGSLTGEINRVGSLVETARRKALQGMEATGLPIGMASEGEFLCTDRGVVGHEVLVFIDKNRGLELVEEQHAVPTNYRVWTITSFSELDADLQAVGFPAHRLTVRPNTGELRGLIFKGVSNRRVLEMAIETARAHSEDGRARVETDMRAHQNPTRMKGISSLADRLAVRIAES